VLPPSATADLLYEEAACALLLTARDGTLLKVNSTFVAWSGYSAEELCGKRKLQELLTMGGRIFHQTHWAPLLHIQGSVAEVKLEIRHRDGRTLPMVMNAVVRVHDGQPCHHIAIFSAVDRHQYEKELLLARRRAEDLLQQAQLAQQALSRAQEQLQREREQAEDRASFAEQMVGIVSHDLRNPLSAIQMSVNVLNRGELNASQMRVIGRIGSSTHRAARLIADLLDFTQARLGGGLKMRLRAMDLHQVAADVVAELRLAHPEREVVHHARGEGAVDADGDRLAQLLGNLISNALKYGSADQPVTVESEVRQCEICLRVHNHGPAIPEAIRSCLFEPMTRGEDGDYAGRSVGLGLYIVRSIASAHGGQVDVESSDAAGTTFTVRIPAAQAAGSNPDT
jgi:sigma-B regulation protein RsbU (phosphoserine phosphatase)